MDFVTFSEKELTQTTSYTKFNKPHLLISISNPNHKVMIPNSHYCKEVLRISFEDVEDITNNGFNQDIARQILDFVNNHCNSASAIVVQCGAGISRSVAVASALSKIINHKDDFLFSYGIPNMLVYITLLETYFMEKYADVRWSSIFFRRNKNMQEMLEPSVNRISEYKIKKRKEDKGEFDE